MAEVCGWLCDACFAALARTRRVEPGSGDLEMPRFRARVSADGRMPRLPALDDYEGWGSCS
jgi:hypothetical protein